MDVYSGDSAAKCRDYREEYGFHVDFGWDEWGEVYSNYMGSGFPSSVVIDCEDPPVVVWTRVGACYDSCAQDLQQQIEDDWLPLCNSDPELSNSDFDPSFGRTDTDFSFYVDYYDDDGDAPASIVVYVNDVPHGMVLDTGDPDNGTYVWTGTIAQEGLATFYFTADDGRSGTARFPASGELDGPYVYDDYNPPSSSCSAPARSQSNNITVDYTSSDDKAGVAKVDLWMQCNGGGYSLVDSSGNPNGSFNVTLGSGNGVYDFYTRATDLVGNEEDPPGSPDASTIYDDTAPDSSADAGIAYYWRNLPIEVDFNADDNLSGVASTRLWYRYEGGAWTDSGLSQGGASGTFDFNAPQGEGVYAFYTIATDLNGNVENPPAGAQANVLYDATKPVSSCTSISETNAVSVDIDFTASDNDQVDRVSLWYSHDGGAWTDTGQTISAASGTFTFTFADGDGLYGFYTVAQDMAGNVEDPPAAADTTVNLDQTMPESSCTAAPLVSQLPFQVQFTASDAGTGVASTKLWYRFAGETQWQDSYQTLTGESGTFLLDPIALTPQWGDGDYELITIATDNVGNKEAPPGVPDATVTLDTTPPLSSVDCIGQTSASPLTLTYSANDNLSGIAKVALWYSFNGGDWTDSGLFDTFGTTSYSVSAESGTFQFVFTLGDGVYDFMTLATDVAGNVELAGIADCTCTFDTTPPVSSGQTDGVVNDPTITVTFSSADDYTGISDVHLFYRYTDLNGVIDDTLRDTGRYSEEASGQFVWVPDMGPGYYNFYIAATDGAGNVEGTDGDADATCLYDPRFALSSMDAPQSVTEPTVPITFGVDIGNDGYDHVTLYYRYGATLPDAEAASWITTSTVSTEPSGTFDFTCTNGDGYYQFFTRATSGSWIVEPIPDVPDATTLYDGVAPETSVSGATISSSGQFDLTYTSAEAYGLAKIDIYYCYQGGCYLFTTVHDANGTVTFDAEGNEGVYEFYTIGTDVVGNVEAIPPGGYDCAVTVDLLPPQSAASVDTYGTGFPIEVTFNASDTVTQVTNVALWAKFADESWFDTGLSGVGESGTLEFTPASALEGTYYFYTVASDEAGHTEGVPAAPDDQVTIDWTAPETSCSSPEFTNNATVPLSYTASDAVSGMSSVSAWIYTGGAWQDTGLVGPANGGVINVDVSAWGEGTFGFCTIGRDNCGNVESLPSEPVTTTLYDVTEPTSTAGLPAEGVIANTTPISVPYTADDSASGVSSVSLWFKFNGGAWQDSGLSVVPDAVLVTDAGSFSFTPPHGEGTYQFATRALDRAGNLEALPESPDGGALVFDQTPPTSSVAFEGNYAIAFPITLTFTAADTTSGIASVALYVSLDGGAYEDTGLRATGTEGTFDYTPDTLVAGVYRFYTIATDNAGNVETVPGGPEATVIFDTVAPVSVASVSAQYTNSFPIVVSFTASDAGTGLVSVELWVSLDGGAFVNTGLSSTESWGTFNYMPATLTDGTFRFYTIASDVAGNVEPAPDTADASIVVDRAVPTSSCSIEGTFVNSFPLSVDYTSADTGTGVEHIDLYYRYNGGNWGKATTLTEPSGTFAFTPDTTADGYYEFYTKAFDYALNAESTAGPDDGVKVDTTPPISSVTAPDSVKVVPFFVLFNARDDGAGVSTTSLWYSYNGGEWVDSGLQSSSTAGQFEFTAPDGQGSYRFYTICEDKVGNVENAPGVPDALTVYHIPAPDVYVSTDSLNFGNVNVGNQGMSSFTVSNYGDADLTLSEVSSDNPAFSVSVMGKLPQKLAPNVSVPVSVVFAPDAEGDYTGEVSIVTDDSDTPVVTIALSGIGAVVPGEFTVDIWPNQNTLHFGDTLTIEMRVANTDEPVSIDLYAVLTYDYGGPDERSWSASPGGTWTEGFSMYRAGWEIETGHDETTEILSETLPCEMPMVVKSGGYTLRIAALQTGTLNFVTDMVTTGFWVEGNPFVDISTDKDVYSANGDTIQISLDADVPFALTADFYVVLFAPDGSFWCPTAFGEAGWVEGGVPLLAGITLSAGFEFSSVAFSESLPTGAPFNQVGSYMVYSALVEPGTMTPLSDVGVAAFSLQ